MKRSGLLVIFAAVLALCVFTEETAAEPQGQRANARGGQQAAQPGQNPQQTPQARMQNQMRVIISNFYSTKFREALELTDEQFIKMSFFIQSFIDMRFNAAMRRDAINRQLEQLQSQPNPSLEAVEELVAAKVVLDNNFGNMQNQFFQKIRPDLKPGQILKFLSFNTKFFEEDLPKLIEQARQNAPQGRQEQAPVRPNQQNQRQNDPNRPANALRRNQQGQN